MQTHRPCPDLWNQNLHLKKTPQGSHMHIVLWQVAILFSHALDACKEPTTNARAFIWIVTSFSFIFSPFTQFIQQHYGLLTLERNWGWVVGGRKKGWNILYEIRYKTSHQDRAWSGLHEWLDHCSRGMKTGPLVTFLNRKHCGRSSIGGSP